MNEPLLPAGYVPSPRRRASITESLLRSLPEDEQVDIPVAPSSLPDIFAAGAFKERIIFGNVDDEPPDLLRSPRFATPRIRIPDDGGDLGREEEDISARHVIENIDCRAEPGGREGVYNNTNNILQYSEEILGLNPGKRRSLHRSRTAPAMWNASKVKQSLQRPETDSAASIARQAVIYLILYLSVGVFIYSFNKDKFSGNETNAIVDALYFCIVTMCTIGYGDITPMTTSTKLFSCFFVLVGFGFIDILLGGMVTYVLDKQENLLLHTVEGSRHDLAKTYIVDVKKGRMRIRMKVALALGVVILCIGVGTTVMHFSENLGWTDSFYLSVMSVTTVGYGDHAFKTLPGRLFASIWLLVSTLAVARAFLYFAEARIDKRHRLIAKWVLHRDMTIEDLVAADIDNNGFVSKSEYVIYKLKEMGKVEEKDIVEIVKQFNRLDTDNCGKITLSLLSSH
ncbi:hypothetical protein SUGI_0058370 [Cryptomeria japonica]|uniref:two-pore potassium channel 5 isoform X1 n=1 Tax=Cryptomeria japonica TaxID=3369 RepID=UPI002408DFE4|nr:two-pore potassium channel 5 isoform X1 [Cryptomeria japonica]GLJ07106.1 hypothetical protein SUGI_0058370 [Cryptomeria japonica]